MDDTRVAYEVQLMSTDIYEAFEASAWWARWKNLIGVFGLLTLAGAAFTNTFVYFAPGGLIFALIPFYTIFSLKRSAKRTLESPAFSSPQEVVIDHEGLTTTTGASHGHMKWTQFLKWHECKTAFLLYMTPYAFVIIPKRCVPHELDALRELLRANVQGGTSLEQLNRRRAALRLVPFLILCSICAWLLWIKH